MGCQQAKSLEKDWQAPASHSPSPSPSDGDQSLVAAHAKTRISEIGAPVLQYYDYSVKRFLQEGGSDQTPLFPSRYFLISS
jgi:hypothetical protein